MSGGFVAMPGMDPNSGYPPPQQGDPPPQEGYPPLLQGYPPPQQGYSPPQQGYPPPQAGYPPPQAGMPMTKQPQAMGPPGAYGGMMPAPQAAMVPANCPPGLAYLTQINQLIIKQKVELLEAFTGYETNNQYEIKNSMGQDVYKAKEDTDCCTRMCCGPGRPFDMIIRDNSDNEVIHLERPLRCSSCCYPCCLQEITVSSPPGSVIGSVSQDWSICAPHFSIKDHNGDTVLKIEGPICTVSCCGDVEFKVLTADGETEAYTDADNFGISFPMDLDVRVKATLLGALFLIDYMFFEKTGNQNYNTSLVNDIINIINSINQI